MFHLFSNPEQSNFFIIKFIRGGYLWSGWLSTEFSAPIDTYYYENQQSQSLREFMYDYYIDNDDTGYTKLGSFRSLAKLQKYVDAHPEFFI